MGVASRLTTGQHWAQSNKSIYGCIVVWLRCTRSYPTMEHHTAMKNSRSPLPLSAQKPNAHSGLKGMHLQIHTCISNT